GAGGPLCGWAEGPTPRQSAHRRPPDQRLRSAAHRHRDARRRRRVPANGAGTEGTVPLTLTSPPHADREMVARRLPGLRRLGVVDKQAGVTLILSAFRPQPCHLATDRQLPDVVGVVISDD